MHKSYLSDENLLFKACGPLEIQTPKCKKKKKILLRSENASHSSLPHWLKFFHFGEARATGMVVGGGERSPDKSQ